MNFRKTIFCFFAIPTMLAFSQSELGLKSAGGHFGYCNPANFGSTISFGPTAELGTLTKDLLVIADMDYYSTSEKVYGDFDNSLWDLSVNGALKYIIPANDARLHFLAGGGIGLHLISKTKSIPQYSYDNYYNYMSGIKKDTKTRFRLALLLEGGATFSISPWIDLLGDLRYTIVSEANALSIRFGLLYKLK